MVTNQPEPDRPILKPRHVANLWFLGIGMTAAIVLLAREAFDVLAFLAFCALVFAAERTLGDWLADMLGPALSKVIFVFGGVGVATLLLSMGTVRNAILEGLESADEVGLHSAVVESASRARPRAGLSGGGTGAPHSRAAPTMAPQSAPSRAVEGRPLQGTRVVLRMTLDPGAVYFQVDVLAGKGEPVTEGRVEFLVDGRVVATGSVGADGRAEGRGTGITPGAHRARARYLGSGQFAESLAEAAFTR